MSTTMTIQQRAEREEKVKAMIGKRMTVAQIAGELGVTSQAVRKFLAIRGWHAKPAA